MSNEGIEFYLACHLKPYSLDRAAVSINYELST
jgi:hypothetical protein